MAETDMPSAYEPKSVEERIYQCWLDNNAFHTEVNPEREPFCIMIPPPNVTAALHMGHACDETIQDILVRWKRMLGLEALWMPGMDHAGIATQNIVEAQLAEEGTSRHELGREKFLERVWAVANSNKDTIRRQLMRLGSSCDWERERFTLDEGCSRAVRETFVRLYRDGKIYRGRRMINWCPRCETGLSDIEVEHRETQGHLWYIRYPAAHGGEGVVVATTRPETMLGDTAVAVHPDDERYKGLVGTTVVLPLMNREIPVIADEAVDPEFGTGVVKITPGHDPNDFEIGERHGLEQVHVIGLDARMTEDAGAYAGIDRYEARKRVLEDLQAQGLLVKTEEHVHAVGRCYRCDTTVEPLVSTQWFVRMRELGDAAMEAVRDGRIRFVPERWTKVYMDWMENLRDWCISRQLWWGHPIPVWYCLNPECGHWNVSVDEPTECEKCGGRELRQDPDVLDTWFSSALWPFSTLGWPDKTPELEYFYPTSVLVTGYDIIYFWVARMIMMGLYCPGDVPFRTVFIHGLVRDAQGRKMSKSLGNVVDPLKLIDQYGTDALRFALALLITHGQDITLAEDRLVGARNFCNKLWNASRLVLMNLDGESGDVDAIAPELLSLADRWILSRHSKAIATVNRHLEDYDFAEAAGAIYEFVWSEFCDWYLEIAKADLYAEGRPERKTAVRRILRRVLEDILKLTHPFMPFITEAIWQSLCPDAGVLARAEYPTEPLRDDPEAEKQMSLVMELTRGIRNLRSELDIPPKQRVNAILFAGDGALRDTIRQWSSYVTGLARLESLAIRDSSDERPQHALSAVVGDAEVFLLLKGVLDAEKELARLSRELAKVEANLAKSESKLANERFLERAPADVVQKERRLLEELQTAKAKLMQRLQIVERMRGAE